MCTSHFHNLGMPAPAHTTGSTVGASVPPGSGGSTGICMPASPTRMVTLGPTVFTAVLHIRRIPARMQAPEKFSCIKAMLLDVAQSYFRHARSLRRWNVCVYQADGDLEALTVHAVFERLVPTSRVDNMVSSWLGKFRWQESDGNSIFQAKRGVWMQSSSMGAVFADLQPCTEGYTASALRMVSEARRQDATMQEASNLRPPPVPAVPLALAAKPRPAPHVQHPQR